MYTYYIIKSICLYPLIGNRRKSVSSKILKPSTQKPKRGIDTIPQMCNHHLANENYLAQLSQPFRGNHVCKCLQVPHNTKKLDNSKMKTRMSHIM